MPWAYICSKGLFAGLIFGRAYFRRGLLLEGVLRFKMGWANNNSPWAYIREGLLSEGDLRLRLRGGGGGSFREGLFI